MSRLKTQSRGFTLVEVMIALGLLAVIAVATQQALSTSFDIKSTVTASNERHHEARQIMTRLSREIRMAFIRAEVPQQFREEKPAVMTRFFGEEDELTFSSTAHLRIRPNRRESDQCEIGYFLKSDSNSDYRGKTLYRRESTIVDDKPKRGGHIWPVAQGIKEFKVEYWDDAKEIGDDAWQRTWDSHEDENSPLLPARVRITLELEMPDDGEPIRYMTQAAPKLRRPINVIDSQVIGRRQ
ncbi:MAG: type II secretion system protein GspJ [Bradymonadia bacterium]